jgi:uncharacterized membrane protein YfcA
MVFPAWAGMALAGAAAGAVNGMFGAGGGMLLVPLLTFLTNLEEDEIFPASVSIILPVCIVSLYFASSGSKIPWDTAWPYLAGGAVGGIFAGIFGKRIPVKWLHRGLGMLILWGGVRYLC